MPRPYLLRSLVLVSLFMAARLIGAPTEKDLEISVRNSAGQSVSTESLQLTTFGAKYDLKFFSPAGVDSRYRGVKVTFTIGVTYKVRGNEVSYFLPVLEDTDKSLKFQYRLTLKHDLKDVEDLEFSISNFNAVAVL